MKRQTRWLRWIAGLAAVVVAAASVVQAVRQGSWGPVVSAAWIPAVILATWPGSHRRCLPRRRGAAR
jgi:hypothetical protein